MCSIVCRKTTASTGSGRSSSTRPRWKLQVAAAVAQARVLEGLGVGVHADHLGRALRGEHVGAVALAAGEVDDAHARAALGDPLVDGEVAPVPVVLLGNVGQRALAGQLERRDALGLVLSARRPWRARVEQAATIPPPCLPPPATPERIKDVNERYHDAAAAELRLQVGHRLRRDRPGAGARQDREGARRLARRAVRRRRSRSAPGTGYFTLNLLQAGRDRATRPRPTSRPEC